MVSEKAAIDRQLKALQAQTGKLTKVTQTSAECSNDVDGCQLELGWMSQGKLVSLCSLMYHHLHGCKLAAVLANATVYQP